MTLIATAATVLLTFQRTRKGATELAKARLEEEKRLRVLAHLAQLRGDVIQRLQRPASIDELLQDVAALLVEQLDAAFVRVWTLDESGRMLELRASAGMYTHLNGEHARVPVGRLKIGRIAQERRPHVTNQVLGDPNVPNQEWARREGLVAFAGFPLMVEDRLLGVIGLFSRHPLAELEMESLGAIAGSLALALAHKKASVALSESEASLRQLADAMPQVVWTARPDGVIDYINSKGKDLIPPCAAFEDGTAVPDWMPIIHPEDQQRCLGLWQGAVRTGQDFEVEYRLQSAGQWRWHLGRALPVRDSAGHILRWYGTCTDIHDLKMIQQAFAAEKDFSAAAINSLPGIFYVVDQANRMRRWNHNLELVSGYSADEISQMTALDFFAPDHRQIVADAIAKVLAEGEVTVELQFRPKSGQTLPYLFSAKRFQFEGQIGLIGAGFDNSESKRAEEVLRRAGTLMAHVNAELEHKVQERTARLEETVADLEHFSYTITHDMRAPLRAMRGLSALLAEEAPDSLDETSRDYVRRIAAAAERMDLLITDALSYSRFAHHHLELEPVNHAELLRGILESYPQFQPPHARVTVNCRIPMILGNPAAMLQCFSNLLNNAVKFVPPDRTPEIRIWDELRGEYVRLWFADNGIGIEERYYEKIWLMFEQINKNYEGTGIGLALVRKVVERMGGKVGVESKPGSGSRFWVDLKQVTAGLQPTRQAA